ncbi:16S rRNA (uracil(1498)-N(3))-methyltransferase [Thermoanaerobacter sp. RKWS2]|uniref:16S rRNA (uracil(1498)-N(3))-methyltransferase n=1 Tax=Thermoanaerobacter sp. RKWS2 TaxID=2983842 RepID=UPI00224B74D1|nr:16S rRNA (uracil(1498)-N(3))-methyltransferase [Thermoanaerobacter sp. RKWS2]UZQ83905.1 16S rRNA (uracil(1498)-N(3))-methyltransferase [Thermoanaerobacter sp. RKWS2]
MRKIFIDRQNIKGEFVYIEGEDFHHLVNVLRLKRGNEIVASDGLKEYAARIEEIKKDKLILFLERELESNTESALEISLFQGLPKSDKMELIIQKCAEIGVKKFIPVVTRYTVVDITKSNINKKIARWRKISEEACKQSGRTGVPEICMPISFEEAINQVDKFDLCIIPYEKEQTSKLKEVLKKAKDVKKIGIFIGPEGGFSQEEIELALNKSIKPVSLGPRILRTETAAIAVCSIVMYELGDMG